MKGRERAVAIALLAYVTFAWGFNWPITKIAVEQIPVWHLRAGTAFLGGICMLALAGALGDRLAVPRRELARLALLSQFNVTGWCLFSAYGISLMEAGRAGIICFTMPIWAAILGAAFGREKMTWIKLAALALGAAGLAALLLPDWREVVAAPFGVLAMLGSAVSWAIGTLGMKSRPFQSSAAVQNGWQLIFGGLTIGFGMLLVGEGFDPAVPDAAAWAAAAYIAFVAVLLAQWAWFGAVHRLSATVAGIGSLMVPVVSVIAGAVWLGEHVGSAEILALLLIGASVLLALRPAESGASAGGVPQPVEAQLDTNASR